MSLCAHCGLNQPLLNDPDDLCRDCAMDAELMLYAVENSDLTPHARHLWCQGCSCEVFVEPNEPLGACFECGARWWAQYPPTDRKKRIVTEIFRVGRA